MNFDPGLLITVPWLVFLIYWIAASTRVKQMRRNEPAGDRLARVAVMGVAFILLWGSDLRYGILDRRFVPDLDWIFLLGAALTAAGVAFAIWARYHIGHYWSSTVALRAGHELVRTGPYARIRHPIYTGMLLAVLGTAVAVGRYRAIVAFLIVLLGFAWKAKKEEALLAGEFGPAFEEHRHHTGFFLPRISPL